jgi:uncharacterized membrane protein YagU involved in acid resistance
LFFTSQRKGLFQYIASALLGSATAVSLGWPSVALGIGLHTGVSLAVVLAYFFIGRKLSAFRSRPLLAGPIFGLAVYCVMHYLVLPLTAVPKVAHPEWKIELANQLFAHIFMVGIPTAVIVSRLSAPRETGAFVNQKT